MKKGLLLILISILIFCFMFFIAFIHINNKNESQTKDNHEKISTLSINIEYIDNLNKIVKEFDIHNFVLEKPQYYEEITLVAAGDNLIHSMIIKSGLTENETYDFNYMYDNIRDYINQFDIKVLNQETVLINDSNKYSGYPTFGSPTAIGESVINCGFNVITQATNHAYDKKEEGILDSINFWDTYNIPVIGIHNEENSDVFIYEYGYTKIAMLNYTYSLNGFSLPNGKDYLVDSLYDEEKILSDLAYAKENADIIIVFPHWGVEYTHTETKEQQRLAQFFADNGADIIIGTHPHVIEPLKHITTSDGKIIPIFYSIGNFISNQDEIPRMLGALAEITIVNDNGNVYVKDEKMTPIITHIENYSKEFKVYLLSDYTEDLASIHRLRRVKGKSMSLENIWNIWNNVIENNT